MLYLFYKCDSETFCPKILFHIQEEEEEEKWNTRRDTEAPKCILVYFCRGKESKNNLKISQPFSEQWTFCELFRSWAFSFTFVRLNTHSLQWRKQTHKELLI